jgi:hypothetical protein
VIARPRRCRPALRAALAAALAVAGGCAHQGGTARTGGADSQPPAADSVTVGLWRFNETAGARNADAGPFRLAGTAGIDVRADFGRFGGARRFQRTIQSFVLVPHNPLLQPPAEITCEAWIYPTQFGQYEDTPIAACWTEEPGRRSWLFALGGERQVPPLARLASPGFHDELVPFAAPGRLLFAFVPEEAGAPRAFLSARPVRLERWTHVAATYDGQIVRFYLDGLLDSQYAFRGRIRASNAPLLIGNYLDVRFISGFGGFLRAEQSDANPYYAFVGLLDELRISSAARADFPKATRP